MIELTESDSFAIFRLPDDNLVYFIRQIIPNNIDFDSKISERSGFIIFPFDNTRHKNVFTGAEIGYNPVKPGRPSHVVHTYWISGMRLVLDAEVQNGKAIAGCHGLPRLLEILGRLPPESRPRLVRGDIGFGVEWIMKELEAIDQPYLFKLRQSAGVVRLIERLWKNGDWQDVGAGERSVEAK